MFRTHRLVFAVRRVAAEVVLGLKLCESVGGSLMSGKKASSAPADGTVWIFYSN